MSHYLDFYHADLGRIVRDLETELNSCYPDWQRILAKADDLIALALAAKKDKPETASKL